VQVEQGRALAGAHEAELAAVDVDRVPDKCHRLPTVPSASRESVGEVGKGLKRFFSRRYGDHLLALSCACCLSKAEPAIAVLILREPPPHVS